MRPAPVSMCVFFTVFTLAAACGGSEAPVLSELPAPPIALRAADPTPSCYVPPPQADASEVASDAYASMISAAKQMAELQLSFAFQEAELLSRPVREDPTASSWNVQLEDGSVEGAVLARGTDWSVLKMVAIARTPRGTISRDADIDVTPRRTVYDFGADRVLEVREHLFRFGQWVRGCDPETRTSFEIWPKPVMGAVVHERRCWPERETPRIADPRASAEFRASAALLCLQLIERALLD